eukprot:6209223-Pleurochrysis_carterae.AAC.8
MAGIRRQPRQRESTQAAARHAPSRELGCDGAKLLTGKHPSCADRSTKLLSLGAAAERAAAAEDAPALSLSAATAGAAWTNASCCSGDVCLGDACARRSASAPASLPDPLAMRDGWSGLAVSSLLLAPERPETTVSAAHSALSARPLEWREHATFVGIGTAAETVTAALTVPDVTPSAPSADAAAATPVSAAATATAASGEVSNCSCRPSDSSGPLRCCVVPSTADPPAAVCAMTSVSAALSATALRPALARPLGAPADASTCSAEGTSATDAG